MTDLEKTQQMWKERGWDGVSCMTCFCRRWTLDNEPHEWNIGFHWCPSCAASWR